MTVVPGARPAEKPRLGWPSVDLFLHSMAEHLGPRAIAIVLSGMMQDAATGIEAVRRGGGATMVQDPRMAKFPDMPSAAVDLGRADLMMSPGRIAEALVILSEVGVARSAGRRVRRRRPRVSFLVVRRLLEPRSGRHDY